MLWPELILRLCALVHLGLATDTCFHNEPEFRNECDQGTPVASRSLLSLWNNEEQRQKTETEADEDPVWPTDTKYAEEECGTKLAEQPDFKKATMNFPADSVTLTTQCDTHRLSRVRELANQWQGPISLALMVQEHELQKVRTELTNMGEAVDKFVTVHVMTAENRPSFYPINAMRNLALRHATTEWVFVLDVDENTERMKDHLDAMRKTYDALPDNQSQVAFAVRSFEWTGLQQAGDAPPSTGKELAALFEQDKVTTKHPYFAAAYSIPTISFVEWTNMTAPKLLPVKDAFEPYFIMRRSANQFFNSRFVGYGGNKVSLTFKMQLNGWRFKLLPGVFTFAPEVTHRCGLPRADVKNRHLHLKTLSRLAQAFPACRKCTSTLHCLGYCEHLRKDVVRDPVACFDFSLRHPSGMVAAQMNPFKRLYHHVTRCYPCDLSLAQLKKFTFL